MAIKIGGEATEENVPMEMQAEVVVSQSWIIGGWDADRALGPYSAKDEDVDLDEDDDEDEDEDGSDIDELDEDDLDDEDLDEDDEEEDED